MLRPPLLLAALLPALLSAISPAAATAVAAQPMTETVPPNPFAGFESIQLANGLRVWYRHTPGLPLATLAVMVPYGRDHDPPGKEQTAHLLEHVLLSDRTGRSEAELIRELSARGGSFAGITGPHYTFYPVTLEAEHAAFGLQWLHDVVAPRPFTDELVARNRQPVAIEMDGRDRPVLRGRLARVLNPRFLRPPGFWAREFGYAAHEERAADELAMLAGVTAHDLRRYYDTHYAPPAMTLIAITGSPLAELLPVIEATFGILPWRPAPDPLPATRVRTAESRRFVSTLSSTTRLTLSYRVLDPDGRDLLRLAFIEDLLRHRLTERLRTGAVKSVYGVSTTTEMRGGAAYLAVLVDMDPKRERQVREAVDLELVRLSSASVDTAGFYADRDVISRTLRIEHASAGALRAWAMRRAWRPDLFHAFPDAGEYYATVGADSLAAFASRTFVPAHRITSVARPLPVPPAILLLLAGVVAAAAAALYRRVTFRTARMESIRYIARLRPPLLTRAASAALTVVVLGAAVRLTVAAAHFAVEYWVLPRSSFIPAAGAAALLSFTATLAGLCLAGLHYSKVLVFDDEIRLKSPTFRALVIPAHAVRAAWLDGAGTTSRPGRPAPRSASGGVFLELVDGTRHRLHVRRPHALLLAVDRLRGGSTVCDPAPDAPRAAAAAPLSGAGSPAAALLP